MVEERPQFDELALRLCGMDEVKGRPTRRVTSQYRGQRSLAYAHGRLVAHNARYTDAGDSGAEDAICCVDREAGSYSDLPYTAKPHQRRTARASCL